MADIKLRKWDVVNYLESDEHIVGYLEAVLEDGWPPLLASALVDIARSKRLLDTSVEAPRGQSLLEQAIVDACRRHSKEVPKEIQTAKIRLTKWDVIDNWETDEDIVLSLQIALEDGLPELIAMVLVDIARAKEVFVSNEEVPRGESLLEKAIEESYRRHSRSSDIVPLGMQIS